MARKKFYLIFTKDPPAADVVREDFINEANEVTEDSDCVFRWEKSKDTFEDVPGKVLKIGMKKDLTVLNVNAEGQMVAEKMLGTRKQELEKIRVQQVNAQRLQLQEVSVQLLADGPDAVANQLQPTIKVKRPSLPKKRGAALQNRLRKIIDDMSCFKPGGSKIQLYRGKGIYCDAGKLNVARIKYRRRPKALHQAILKLLVPEQILRLEGLSRTGTRGCVGICSSITETVTLYVSGVYTAAKGKIEDIDYDPHAILKNLVDNTRRRKGVWRLVDSEATNGEGDQDPAESAGPQPAVEEGRQPTPPTSPSTHDLLLNSAVASPSSIPATIHLSTPASSDVLSSAQFRTIPPSSTSSPSTSHCSFVASTSVPSTPPSSPHRESQDHSYSSPKYLDISISKPPACEVDVPWSEY